jgi:hypothetical protein
MAFPFPIDIDRSFSAEQLQTLRTELIRNVFIQPTITRGVPQQLAQIAQVLERTATNEPTAYENGAIGTGTSATGNASLLTRQVERALTQVLGRAPGRGVNGFIQALNGAFPVGASGQIVFTPARSVVSLYSPYGEDNRIISGTNSSGLMGQLSVSQANLYRQASIIVNDALKVLSTLEPFDPTADIDAVEALRTLIQTQMQSLIEEFGRLDEPRPDRVNAYLNAMRNSLDELGRRARLGNTEGGENGGFTEDTSFPVTTDDEAQVAALELIDSYIDTLRAIWIRFFDESPAEELSGNYSQRLSRVSVLLPVIADSNASFMAAMDSIGFTESERRSDAALFTSLGPPESFLLSINGEDLPFNIGLVTLPDITVNDFNEWIDRFITIEAPSMLASSGRFGLDFVTDQADTLFWVIGFVLDYIESNQNGNRESLLENILSFDRVKQTLKELAFQLDTLADFGVSNNSN